MNALAAPVLSAAAVPDGSGYFEANAQGAVTNHGAALGEGSTDEVQLGAPIRQVVSTPNGNGYWLVAADGGVFAYGDAGYYGSMAGHPLAAPMVGLAPTADGRRVLGGVGRWRSLRLRRCRLRRLDGWAPVGCARHRDNR